MGSGAQLAVFSAQGGARVVLLGFLSPFACSLLFWFEFNLVFVFAHVSP